LHRTEFHGLESAKVIQINITRSGLDLQALPEIIGNKVLPKFMKALADLAYDTMLQRAPYRTGGLRLSIVKRTTKDSAEVGPTVSYAPYVEFGTKPHEIRPINARALRFEVGGRTVFAKTVWHPGTRPHPFIAPAFEQVARRMGPIWQEKFGQEIK